MRRKAILILELKFHQEIIPSQLLFLKENDEFESHLILNRDLWDDDLLGGFNDNVKITLVEDVKSVWGKLKFTLMLLRYIKQNNIDYLIFNTFESNFNSLLIKALGAKVKYFAVLHQVHLLKTNSKFASMFKKLEGAFVLSEFTLSYFQKHFPEFKKVALFYPIFFTQNISLALVENSLGNDILVVVPGQMDSRKRDYLGLVNLVEKCREQLNGIKFNLLGNASIKNGPQIIKAIAEKSLEEFFIYNQSFVSYRSFFETIKACDYIMPLLSSHDDAIPYDSSQISASFNWAYGFDKTLLIEAPFATTVIREINVTTYTLANFGEVLINLPKPTATPNKPKSKLSFINQATSYLNLLR